MDANMEIVAALFIEDIKLRPAAGPSTRIDLGGIHFSLAAPEPVPTTVTPHLVVIVRCPPGHTGHAALEVTYHRGDEQLARNVAPLQIQPGKFGYQLVRAELAFDDYETIEARCRIDLDEPITVPFTLLPPAPEPDPADGGA